MEYLSTFQQAQKFLETPGNRLKLYFAVFILYSVFLFFCSSMFVISIISLINLDTNQKIALTSLLGLSVYVLISKYDVLKYIATITKTFSVVKNVSSGDTINTIQNFISGSNKNSNVDLSITFIENSITIPYKSHGRVHKIIVPYDPNNIAKYSGMKVFAEYNQNGTTESKEITHQLGVPYLISPDHIGASRIYCISETEPDDIIHECTGSIIFMPPEQINLDFPE